MAEPTRPRPSRKVPQSSDELVQRIEAEDEFTDVKDVDDEKLNEFYVNHLDFREKCPLSDHKGHDLPNCPRFLTLLPLQRKKFILKTHRCISCLKRGHNLTSCRSSKACGKGGCGNLHHPLLHGDSSSTKKPDKPQSSRKGLDEAIFNAVEIEDLSSSESSKGSYMPAGPVKVSGAEGNSKKSLQLVALLDSGSSHTCISARAAAALNLKGHRVATRMSTPSSSSPVELTEVKLSILSPDGTKRLTTPAYVLPNFPTQMQFLDWSKNPQFFQHLPEDQKPAFFPLKSDFAYGTDLIIGNNCVNAIRILESRDVNPDNQIVFERTPLFWTARGPIPSAVKRDLQELNLHAVEILRSSETPDLRVQRYQPAEANLHEAMDDLYLNDDSFILWKMVKSLDLPFHDLDNRTDTPLEKSMLEYLDKLFELEGNVAKVPILWLEGSPPTDMPDNSRAVLQRTKASYSKLDAETKTFIEDYFKKKIDDGIMKIISASDLKPGCFNFIPYLLVRKTTPSTTPIRIVLDASAKYGNKSLNDRIEKGPNLLNLIPSSLIAFRDGPIGFSLDIKEMFLNVRLRPEDEHYCLIWAFIDGEWKILQYKSHIFGKRDSPNVVLYCVCRQAKSFQDEKPEAAKFLQHSTIMDDLMGNADDPEECLKILDDVKSILGTLNMECHKIICSSPEVLKHLDPQSVSKQIKFDSFGEGECKENDVLYEALKTLGLLWDGNTDIFSYEVNDMDPNTVWTKRKILSKYAKIYDPNGWILPFVILGRLAFQAACVESMDWDAPLNLEGEAMKIWTRWLTGIPEIKEIQIPRMIRCFKKEHLVNREVHIFSDASKNFIGACAFICNYYLDGNSESHNVFAKGNVAPIMAKSLPRLELAAAELATRLVPVVYNATRIPSLEYFYWTDSQNVLYWLRQSSRSLPVFEANRTSAIQSSTKIANWRHVEGVRNPADVITRPQLPAELQKNELWWIGPDFLRSKDYPPQKISTDLVDPDAFKKRVNIFHVEFKLEGKLADYINKVPRLSCIIALVTLQLRFRRKLDPNTIAATKQVFLTIFAQIQDTAYSNEIGDLARGKFLSPSHELAKHCPFIAEDGLLRARSRLSLAAGLLWEEKNPVLVYRRHPWAQLLLQWTHEQLRHTGGVDGVLSEIRAGHSAFWIPKGRCLARKVVTTCIKCQRMTPRFAPQRMSPLPNFRVESQPFAVVGMDCFGPYHINCSVLSSLEKKKLAASDIPKVKVGRPTAAEAREKEIRTKRKESVHIKCYALIVTCATTRAVILEPLMSMDTRSVGLAIQRFISNHRKPDMILSDEGTNFHGFQNVLAKLKEDATVAQVAPDVPELNWTFNQPLSPHKLGFVERLVGESKKALKKITQTQYVDVELFFTLLKQVQSIVNSRPINSPSNLDEMILTPNHFIQSKVCGNLCNIDESNFHQAYGFAEEASKEFWKLLHAQIMKTQTQTLKWLKTREPLEVDEIAVLMDNTNNFGKYPLCRILSICPSKDGPPTQRHHLHRGRTYPPTLNAQDL